MGRYHPFVYAVAYGGASVSITIFNKAVFRIYSFTFPITILCIQMAFSIVFLMLLRFCSSVPVGRFSFTTSYKLLPLTIIWVLNVWTGVSAQQFLTVSTMSTLRKLTTPIIMAFNYFLLGKSAVLQQWLSVSLMVVSGVCVSLGDMEFHPVGYSLIMFNNMLTAGHLLSIPFFKSHVKNNFSMMLHNNITCLPILLLVLVFSTNELPRMASFPHFYDLSFWCVLVISCAQAFLYNYALFLCTANTSAVTTSVTGQLSKLLTVVIGVLLFRDTTHTLLNSSGVCMGLLASSWYAYIKYQEICDAKGDKKA